jgi:hypothetical protein
MNACKPKEADLQTTRSSASKTAGASQLKFAWCKASPTAWSRVVDAIDSMEKAGRASLSTDASSTGSGASLQTAALELLKNPPQGEPPRCDEAADAALSQSDQQVAVALGQSSKNVAFALGGSCEIQNSTGIMSITRLPSGYYRIEILGCGGHQRSEMILNPKQLKSLGGTLLRGV